MMPGEASDNSPNLSLDRSETAGMGITSTTLEAPQTLVTSGRQMDAIGLSDDTTHSIVSMLERPTIIGKGTLARTFTAVPQAYELTAFQSYVAGTVPEGLVAVHSFPGAIFKANPLVAEKANNFSFLSADVELEFKINASPFTSGCIAMIYAPMADDLENLFRFGNLTLPGVTSYPNAKLFVDQTTTMKMVVPYISQFERFSLHTPRFQFGTVALVVLSAIGGDSDLEWTLFARFKNVRLRVADDREIQPSTDTNRLRIQKALANAPAEDIRAALSALSEEKTDLMKGFYAQGAETETKGIVSTVADGVSTIAGALENVPFVGKFAQPVGWISRAVGKVASFFGFSKPLSMDGVKWVNRVPGMGMFHGEGTDMAQGLGVVPDNGINPIGSCFESVDEMELAYVLNRTNLVETFTWAASSASGAFIGQMRYHPLPIGASVVQMGSFDYVCNLFDKWRGTVIRSLEFVKTKFHMGRVAVVFIPSGKPPALLGDLLSTNYHCIIDLNEISVEDGTDASVVLSAPFLSNRIFTSIGLEANDAFRPVAAIYVLNPLRAPEQCEQSVEILASIRAGPDFALAFPTGNYNLAPWPDAPTPPPPSDNSVEKGFVTQGFEQDNSVAPLSFVPNCNTEVLKPEVLSIGEKVTSLRTLTRRFSPYMCPQSQYGTSNYPTVRRGMKASMADQIAWLYRFAYGGRRFKVFVAPGEVAVANVASNASPVKATGVVGSRGTESRAIVSGSVNNFLEVELPFYSSTRLLTVGANPIPDEFSEDNPMVTMRKFSLAIPPFSRTATAGTTPGFYDCHVAIDPVTFQAFVDAGGSASWISQSSQYDEVDVSNIGIDTDQLNFTIFSARFLQVEAGETTPTNSFKYGISAGNAEDMFESLSDTAGYTFLVAPPPVKRNQYRVIEQL